MPPTRYATGISQRVFASGSHKVSSKASKWQYQLKTLCGKLAAMELLWKFSVQCFFFFFLGIISNFSLWKMIFNCIIPRIRLFWSPCVQKLYCCSLYILEAVISFFKFTILAWVMYLPRTLLVAKPTCIFFFSVFSSEKPFLNFLLWFPLSLLWLCYCILFSLAPKI